MNQQIFLVATVFLSVAVVFLFYQNVKLERKFNREVLGLTNNMKEMTQMIALNNDISTNKAMPEINEKGEPSNMSSSVNENNFTFNEPEVSEGLVNEMSTLMRDYSEFNEPEISQLGESNEVLTPDNLNILEEKPVETEKYDSISEELKREIEELEKRDSSSECVEEVYNEGLENVKLDLEEMSENNKELELELEEVAVANEEVANEEVANEEVANEEVEGLIEEVEDELEEIKTFDENALEQLNPAGDYKNMVDEIIATASEAENNNETEEQKASWDGTVDITEEGIFVELDSERKEVSSLSVKELTYICKMSGIKTKGKKADLISRFTDYSTQKKNTFFLEIN